MPTTLPLSVQQEWLCDVIRANETWQCVAARAFSVSGPLNIPLLQQCLREVVDSHGALRTHIAAHDGILRQEILDPQPYVLERVTITGASSAQINANARRYVEDLCDRKMILCVEPLWSARLLGLSEHEHWLVFAMHRLIGDCVSIDQTYHETKLLYGERLQGRPSPPKPVAQYRDYTLWQEQTSVDWVNRHGPFWEKRLTGAAPVQWPSEPSFATTGPGILGKANCSFGPTVSAGLKTLARSARTLPAVPMLSIYAAVLWQWCRQTDFVLPLNTAGRPTSYKATIGYFSYVLYLCLHITGEESFRELMGRIGSEFFSALSHQDFGRLARERPELLSGTLFQWVTWHPDDNAPGERVDVRDFGEGLTIVPPGMTALEVTVFDSAAGLCAFGSYRADRFTARTMERFMADLRRAAELFIGDPDTRIAAIVEPGGHIHGTAERAGRDIQWGANPDGGERSGTARF